MNAKYVKCNCGADVIFGDDRMKPEEAMIVETETRPETDDQKRSGVVKVTIKQIEPVPYLFSPPKIANH
jgi:hypothetical protein